MTVFRAPHHMSALSAAEASRALARCSRRELELLVQVSAHECALMLEAVVYGDATIVDPSVRAEEEAT